MGNKGPQSHHTSTHTLYQLLGTLPGSSPWSSPVLSKSGVLNPAFLNSKQNSSPRALAQTTARALTYAIKQSGCRASFVFVPLFFQGKALDFCITSGLTKKFPGPENTTPSKTDSADYRLVVPKCTF